MRFTVRPRSETGARHLKICRGLLASISFSLLAACSSFIENTAPSSSSGASNVSEIATDAGVTKQREPSLAAEQTANHGELVSYNNLWDRLRAGLVLQEAYTHPEVSKQLPRFRNQQAYFDTVVARAEPFLFYIVDEAERRKVPLEIALLPFVESAFDPNAYSQQRAVGLWQFMASTARGFELRQDWWVDDRRDPLESSRAALDYLESLHNEFDGDWLLALAAYNTGAGNVRRAQRRNDNSGAGSSLASSEFWQLGLTGETRAHVPRILALAQVIANPSQFEIALPTLANDPQLKKIDLARQIDLSRAADLSGLELAELQRLNPRYRQWATPPDGKQWLYLPPAAASRFEKQIAATAPETLVTFDRYAIRSGDTLGAIARRLGTRVDVLQRVNGLKGTRIVAGRSLLIPRGDGVLSAANLPQIEDREARSAPEIYTVRRGDNLWSIARRYQLRSADIRRLNALEEDPLLKPGQKLRLLPTEAVASD